MLVVEVGKKATRVELEQISSSLSERAHEVHHARAPLSHLFHFSACLFATYIMVVVGQEAASGLLPLALSLSLSSLHPPQVDIMSSPTSLTSCLPFLHLSEGEGLKKMQAHAHPGCLCY